MMYTKSIHDSHKSPTPRLRLARKAKRMNMDMKDAKTALDIIIRPSLQLWKLALGRTTLSVLRRPQKTIIFRDSENTSSTSSISSKRVRFDEQPITISRKGFFERLRKDSSSSPARPCLVIRIHDEVCHKFPEPPLQADNCSVYEDCLSEHPGFLPDLHVLEGDECSDTRHLKRVRRSEFYETESGIAMFDQVGYANYCLSLWLDKRREEAWVLEKQKQHMFEGRAFLLRSNPPLSQPSDDTFTLAYPVPPLPQPIHRSRSIPWRIWKYVGDELQNAIVVLLIGLLIHICLFTFLLYDILTRGLIPSDD